MCFTHTIDDHKGRWKSITEFKQTLMPYFKATINDDTMLEDEKSKANVKTG